MLIVNHFVKTHRNKDAPVTSKTLFRHLKRGNICVSNSGSVQIYNAIFLKRKTVKKIWNIFKFMFLFRSILIFFTSTYIFTSTSRLPLKKSGFSVFENWRICNKYSCKFACYSKLPIQNSVLNFITLTFRSLQTCSKQRA